MEQGTNCITSLKNKLPNVATLATKKHKKTMEDFMGLS